MNKICFVKSFYKLSENFVAGVKQQEKSKRGKVFLFILILMFQFFIFDISNIFRKSFFSFFSFFGE